MDGPFVAAAVRITGIDALAEPGELDDADALHTIVRISIWERAVVEWAAIGVCDAAGFICGNAGERAVAPAALLIRAAAGAIADNAPGRAAKLFAIAFANATGVVATDADAGIAALRATLGRTRRARTSRPIPDLATRAFGDRGRRRWTAGSLRRLQSRAGGQTAETEQSLEHRAAILSAGKRADKCVEPAVFHMIAQSSDDVDDDALSESIVLVRSDRQYMESLVLPCIARSPRFIEDGLRVIPL